MHLVGQIGKADVTHELFANDIYAVKLWVRGEGRIRTVRDACRGVAIAGRDEGVGHLGQVGQKEREGEGKKKKITEEEC